MKQKNTVRCIIIFFILFTATSFAQPEAHPHAQIFLGYAPYKMNAAKYSFQTGGEFDRSPIPSMINVDQKKTETAVTFGGRFGVLVFQHDNPFRFNFDLEGDLNVFTGSFASARFSLTFEPEFKRESFIAPFLGVGINGYTIWGDIGEVGATNPQDLMLEAPDGHNYPIGSKISITSNFLFGISTYIGLRFYTGEFNNIFVSGGYQIAAEASKWNYEIIDADNSEYKYSIPRNIFPQHPNAVNLDGLFFRIGFSFTP